MTKKIFVPFLIGLCITLLFSGGAIVKFLPLEHMEYRLYDLRYKIRGKTPPPKDVVIVTIDDKSLEKIGRWPWDRSKIAAVIDALKQMGAKVIALDIIFSEPSKDDAILKNSIQAAGNVILPVVFQFGSEKKIVQDDALFNAAIPMIRNLDDMAIFPPISAGSILRPMANLSSVANTLGHINMIADADGVLRFEVLAIEYNGEFYPSIGLQAARLYQGVPMEALSLNLARGVQLQDAFIPTDFWNRTLIHYYGPEGSFPLISIVDVMEGKVHPSAVKGKIVFIGATAIGIYDLRVTPTSPDMPGVEKHANVTASILQQKFVHRVKNIVNVILILLTGILFSIFMTRARALMGALIGLVFISGVLFAGYFILFKFGLWIDMSYSTLSILSIYLVTTAYRYTTEERHARQVKAMFSSYVTEKLVNELIKNPELAKLGGERREITVLFSDVRGFTTFSEQHSPEEVVAQLNEYLTAMSEVIFRWDGTLDKYIGDAIVAFWGAPVPQENHAELAVKCALNMVQRLGELQKKWIAEGKVPLAAGIGINTGEVVVGNIGSEGKKMDYTVIGDHVNLGARVESLTKKYNSAILVTEFTMNKIMSRIKEGAFYRLSVAGVDRVIVKGKDMPVTLCAINATAPGSESSIEEEWTFEEARRLEEK